MAMDPTAYVLGKQRLQMERDRNLQNAVGGLAGMAGYMVGPQYGRDQKMADDAVKTSGLKVEDLQGGVDASKAATGLESEADTVYKSLVDTPPASAPPAGGIPAPPPPMPPPGGVPGTTLQPKFPMPPAGSLFPGPHPGNGLPALSSMGAAPSPGTTTLRALPAPKGPSPAAPAPGAPSQRRLSPAEAMALRRGSADRRMAAWGRGSGGGDRMQDLALMEREDLQAVLADQEFVAQNLGDPAALKAWTPSTKAGRAAKVEALGAASERGIKEADRVRERDEKRTDRTGMESFQKAMQQAQFDYQNGRDDKAKVAAKEKSDSLRSDLQALTRFRTMRPSDLQSAAVLPPEQGGPDFKTPEGWENFLRIIGWQEDRVDEFLGQLGFARDPETDALLPTSAGPKQGASAKPAVTLDQFIENEKSLLTKTEESLRREFEKMEDQYRKGNPARGMDPDAFRVKKAEWEVANRGLRSYDLDAARSRWEEKYGGGRPAGASPAGLLGRDRKPKGPEFAPEEGGDDAGFQKWYGDRAKRLGLDPNPDAPEHKYDYRAAFRSGAEPDASGHWPSKFKADDHPNRFIDGMDTKTGKPGRAEPPSPIVQNLERNPEARKIRDAVKDGLMSREDAKRALKALEENAPTEEPQGLPPAPGGAPALRSMGGTPSNIKDVAPGLQTQDDTKPVGGLRSMFPMGVVGEKGDPRAKYYKKRVQKGMGFSTDELFLNPAYQGN